MRREEIPVHYLDARIPLLVKTVESSLKFSLKGVHRHSFYEILYYTHVDEGDSHCVDFVEYPLLANCFYVLKPGQVYTVNLRKPRGFLFAMTSEYFSKFYLASWNYLDLNSPDVFMPEKEEVLPLKKLMELVFYEYSNRQRHDLLDAYMRALLMQILPMEKNVWNSEPRITTLLTFIDRNYIRERNTAFYAEQLSLCEKRLNVLCKQATGYTVKQLIMQRLLLEAKRMISSGNLTFKEIAYKLGFSDSSYFSRFFKQVGGCTPEQFKQSQCAEDVSLQSFLPESI